MNMRVSRLVVAVNPKSSSYHYFIDHLQELCQQLEQEKNLVQQKLSTKLKMIQNKALDVSGVLT